MDMFHQIAVDSTLQRQADFLAGLVGLLLVKNLISVEEVKELIEKVKEDNKPSKDDEIIKDLLGKYTSFGYSK
jgi:uncharacterized protein YeeX (DUF496 family)